MLTGKAKETRRGEAGQGRVVSVRGRWMFRLAMSLALAITAAMAGSCGGGAASVDPASIGFEHYYMCANDADTVRIGQRDDAAQCLAACKAESATLMGGAAKACWWQDGRAGRPRDCRLCKTAAPIHDVFLNNWAISLPVAK
jgi:hypothetical protein